LELGLTPTALRKAHLSRASEPENPIGSLLYGDDLLTSRVKRTGVPPKPSQFFLFSQGAQENEEEEADLRRKGTQTRKKEYGQTVPWVRTEGGF
jgi:hypothetical protein